MYIHRSLLIGGANLDHITVPTLVGAQRAVLVDGTYEYTGLQGTTLELIVADESGASSLYIATFISDSVPDALSVIRNLGASTNTSPPSYLFEPTFENEVIVIKLVGSDMRLLRCNGGSAVDVLEFPQHPDPRATQQIGDRLITKQSSDLPEQGVGSYVVKYEDRTSSSINRAVDSVSANVEDLERRVREYTVVERNVPAAVIRENNTFQVTTTEEGVWLAGSDTTVPTLPNAYSALVELSEFKKREAVNQAVINWLSTDGTLDIIANEFQIASPRPLRSLVDSLGGHVPFSRVNSGNVLHSGSSRIKERASSAVITAAVSIAGSVRGVGTVFGPRTSMYTGTVTDRDRIKLGSALPVSLVTSINNTTRGEWILFCDYGAFRIDRADQADEICVVPWSGSQSNFLFVTDYNIATPQTLPINETIKLFIYVGRAMPSGCTLFDSIGDRASSELKYETYSSVQCFYGKPQNDPYTISDDTHQLDLAYFKLIQFLDPHSEGLFSSAITTLDQLKVNSLNSDVSTIGTASSRVHYSMYRDFMSTLSVGTREARNLTIHGGNTPFMFTLDKYTQLKKANLISTKVSGEIVQKTTYPDIISVVKALPVDEEIGFNEALLRFIQSKEATLPASYLTALQDILGSLASEWPNTSENLRPSEMVTQELELKVAIYRAILQIVPFSFLGDKTCFVDLNAVASTLEILLLSDHAYFDSRDVGRVFTLEGSSGTPVSLVMKTFISNKYATFYASEEISLGSLTSFTLDYTYGPNSGAGAGLRLKSSSSMLYYSLRQLDDPAPYSTANVPMGMARLSERSPVGLTSLELSPLDLPPTHAVLSGFAPEADGDISVATFTRYMPIDALANGVNYAHTLSVDIENSRHSASGQPELDKRAILLGHQNPSVQLLSYADHNDNLAINPLSRCARINGGLEFIYHSKIGFEAWIFYIDSQYKLGDGNAYYHIGKALYEFYQRPPEDPNHLSNFFPFSENTEVLSSVSNERGALEAYARTLYHSFNNVEMYTSTSPLINRVDTNSTTYVLTEYLLPDYTNLEYRKSALNMFLSHMPYSLTLEDFPIKLRFENSSNVVEYEFPFLEETLSPSVTADSALLDTLVNYTGSVYLELTHENETTEILTDLFVSHQMGAVDGRSSLVRGGDGVTTSAYTNPSTVVDAFPSSEMVVDVTNTTMDFSDGFTTQDYDSTPFYGSPRPVYLDLKSLEIDLLSTDTLVVTHYRYNTETYFNVQRTSDSGVVINYWIKIDSATLSDYTTGTQLTQVTSTADIGSISVASNSLGVVKHAKIQLSNGIGLGDIGVVVYPIIATERLRTIPLATVTATAKIIGANETLRSNLALYSSPLIMAKSRICNKSEEVKANEESYRHGDLVESAIKYQFINQQNLRSSSAPKSGYTVSLDGTSSTGGLLTYRSALHVELTASNEAKSGHSTKFMQLLSGNKYNPEARSSYVDMGSGLANLIDTTALEISSPTVGVRLSSTQDPMGMQSGSFKPSGLLSVSGAQHLYSLSYLKTNRSSAGYVSDSPQSPTTYKTSSKAMPLATSALHVVGMSKFQGALRITGDSPETIFDIRNLGSSLHMPSGIYGHLNPTQSPRKSKYHTAPNIPYTVYGQFAYSYDVGSTGYGVFQGRQDAYGILVQENEFPPPSGISPNQGKAINQHYSQDLPQLGEQTGLFKFLYEFGVTQNQRLLTSADTPLFPLPRYWSGRGSVASATDADFASEISKYNGLSCIYIPPTFVDKVQATSDAFKFGFSRPAFAFGRDYVGRSIVFKLGFNKYGGNLSDHQSPWFVGIIASITDNGDTYRVDDSDAPLTSQTNEGTVEVVVVPTATRFDRPLSQNQTVKEQYNSFYLQDDELRALSGVNGNTASESEYYNYIYVGDAQTDVLDPSALFDVDGSTQTKGVMYVRGTVHGREWTLNAYQARISDRLFVLNDLAETTTSIYADRNGDTHIEGNGGDLHISGFNEVHIDNTGEMDVSVAVTVAFRRLLRPATEDDITIYPSYFSSNYGISGVPVNGVVPLVPDQGLYVKTHTDWFVNGSPYELERNNNAFVSHKGLHTHRYVAPRGFNLSFNHVNQFNGNDRRPTVYKQVVSQPNIEAAEGNLQKVTIKLTVTRSATSTRDDLSPPFGLAYYFPTGVSHNEVSISAGYYPMYGRRQNSSGVLEYTVSVPLYVDISSNQDVIQLVSNNDSQIIGWFNDQTKIKGDFYYKEVNGERAEGWEDKISFSGISDNFHQHLLTLLEDLTFVDGTDTYIETRINNLYMQPSNIRSYYEYVQIILDFLTTYNLAPGYHSDRLTAAFLAHTQDAHNHLPNVDQYVFPIPTAYNSPASLDELFTAVLEKLERYTGSPFAVSPSIQDLQINFPTEPYRDWVDEQSLFGSRYNISALREVQRSRVDGSQLYWHDRVDLVAPAIAQLFNLPGQQGIDTVKNHLKSSEVDGTNGNEFWSAIGYAGVNGSLPVVSLDADKSVSLQNNSYSATYELETEDVLLNNSFTRIIGTLSEDYWSNWFGTGTLYDNHADNTLSEYDLVEYDYRAQTTGAEYYPLINVIQALRFPVLEIPFDLDVASVNVVELSNSPGAISMRKGSYIDSEGGLGLSASAKSLNATRVGSLSSVDSESCLLGWSVLDTYSHEESETDDILSHSNAQARGFSPERSAYNRRQYKTFKPVVITTPNDEGSQVSPVVSNAEMHTQIGPDVRQGSGLSTNSETGGLLGILGRTRGTFKSDPVPNAVPLELKFNIAQLNANIGTSNLDSAEFNNRDRLSANPSIQVSDRRSQNNGLYTLGLSPNETGHAALADNTIRFRIDLKVKRANTQPPERYSSIQLLMLSRAFFLD